MEDLPPIPPDHPIHKLWEYNEKARTTDGLLELANSGDREAIRTLTGSCLMSLSSGRLPSEEVMEWLYVCLARIQGDEDAAIVFGQRKKGRGRRKDHPTKIVQKVQIVRRVIELTEQLGKEEAAVQQVIQEYGIERSTIFELLATYRFNSPNKS